MKWLTQDRDALFRGLWPVGSDADYILDEMGRMPGPRMAHITTDDLYDLARIMRLTRKERGSSNLFLQEQRIEAALRGRRDHRYQSRTKRCLDCRKPFQAEVACADWRCASCKLYNRG